MSTIKITLPDGSVREFPAGVTGMEIAKSISEGLARNSLSIEVNGENWDLSRPIDKDSTIKEHPQYTRPEVIVINGKKRKVPDVLLSGDHKKIEEWRRRNTE